MAVDPVVGLEFPKRIGLTVGKILMFNPDQAQLAKLLGKDEKDVREPNYESDDDEGNKKLRLDVWFQEETGEKNKVSFFLHDVLQKSSMGKSKFIDRKGNLSYFVESEEKLPQFMKDNGVWEARKGEWELYRFLQAYMDKVNRKESKDFTIDWKKLIGGNVKELNAFVDKNYTNSVIFMLYVKAERKEGEIVEYQHVYNRHFLAAKFMDYFRNPEKIKLKDYDKRRVDEFIKEITDKDHGLKHFYGDILGAVRKYVREENKIVQKLLSNSPFEDDEDGADY